MEPMDQEELRRQAQRAMQRRIGSAAEREEPERPPERPAAPPRRRKTLAERLQDLERTLNEQYERPREMTVPERSRKMDVPEHEDDLRPEVERPREELYPEREAPERRARVPRPREELYPDEPLQVERARRRPRPAEQGNHPGVHEGVHSTASRQNGQRAKIIQELHDPAARRRAILYAEILGPPIALRNLGDNDPY